MHFRRPKRARSEERLYQFARTVLVVAVTAALLSYAGPAQGQATDVTQGPLQGDEWVEVLVELSQPSAIDAYVAARAQLSVTGAGQQAPDAAAQLAAVSQAQVAAAAQEQASFLLAAGTLDADVLYVAQRVYNGVALRVRADRIGELGEIGGVTSVSRLIPKYPDNLRSVPFIGAPPLWQGAAGPALTGKGIRIAVVDTGIDYLHTLFGGPGVGYDENDRQTVGDVSGYPSLKVAGGYDFAGDTYNTTMGSLSYQPIPMPDSDPADCYGHGTHVAGTIAGYGVTSAGATYAGPWKSGLNPGAFRIGPGVAPEATLYALKVFGCGGSSTIVDKALEWSIDPNGDGDFSDRVDVVNMSLGSAFGNAGDTTSRAAEAVVAAGVVVVASSGNSGDLYFITGSPGTADGVISVGATAVSTTPPTGGGGETDVYAGFTSRGPRRDDWALKPDIAAPGLDIVSAENGSGNRARTASGTSMAAPHVAGGVALLRQLHPGWSPEEIKALVMGTAAPIVRAQAAYDAPAASPTFAGAGRIDLDAAIRSDVVAANADDSGQVSLSFGAPVAAHSFSAIKHLRVANLGDVDQSYTILYAPIGDMPGAEIEVQGPQTLTVVAGESSLLNVKLDFDPARHLNLRDPASAAGRQGDVFWFGEETGHIWLWPLPSIFKAALSAASRTAPVAGEVDAATGAFSAHFNPTSRTLSYTLTVGGIPAAEITGVDLVRGPVKLAATEPAYQLYDAATDGPFAAPHAGVITISEVDKRLLAAGYLQIVVRTSEFPSGEIAGKLAAPVAILKVPVYAAPRPASTLQTTDAIAFGNALTATLTLSGAALTASETPTGTRSLVSVFELLQRSRQSPPSQFPPTPGYVDLKYVGMSSDFAVTGVLSETTLFVGLATYAPWSTPQQVEVSLYIDTNQDQFADYLVIMENGGVAETLFRADDRFVSVLYDLSSSTWKKLLPMNLSSPSKQFTAAFGTDVLVIGIPVAHLGLTPGKSRLGISVYTYPRFEQESVAGDWTGELTYDVAHPGLTIGGTSRGSPMLEDRPETTIRVELNRAGFAASNVKGLLLLHHHNENGTRAEEVGATFEWPNPSFLPLIGR